MRKPNAGKGIKVGISSLIHHFPDFLYHEIRRLEDLLVPEAQDAYPELLRQPGGPLAVVVNRLRRVVRRAIQLDRQPQFRTVKVQHVRPDTELAAEKQSVYLFFP